MEVRIHVRHNQEPYRGEQTLYAESKKIDVSCRMAAMPKPGVNDLRCLAKLVKISRLLC